MSGRWGKSRGKKTLQTTLGQAPSQQGSNKSVDESHLRKPINTSVFGLKEAIQLLKTATEEVQDYLCYECDVLYECKICRTIFRSLANFILHKRSYCTEKYSISDTNHIQQQATGGVFVIEDDEESSRSVTPLQANPPTQSSEPSRSPEESPEKPEDAENRPETVDSAEDSKTKKSLANMLDGVVQKLLKKHEVNEMVNGMLNADLSAKPTDKQEAEDQVVFLSDEISVRLEKINDSSFAVFQTFLKDEPSQESKNATLMKSQVMEMHGILGNNEVVLGKDGKVCTFSTNKMVNFKNEMTDDSCLVCSVCGVRFSTPKTLAHHIKYKHNNSCIVYPCPDCREPFANAWGVYRHLYKVHRWTAHQVKRFRAQINSSGVRKDDDLLKHKEKEKKPIVFEDSLENQWINSLEDDRDLQVCGGCGKRFERKAALNSHSQMCSKRIAVCSSLGNKGAKGKSDDDNQSKTNNISANNKPANCDNKPLKGAARRKATFSELVRPPKVSPPTEIKAETASAKSVEIGKLLPELDIKLLPKSEPAKRKRQKSKTLIFKETFDGTKPKKKKTIIIRQSVPQPSQPELPAKSIDKVVISDESDNETKDNLVINNKEEDNHFSWKEPDEDCDLVDNVEHDVKTADNAEIYDISDESGSESNDKVSDKFQPDPLELEETDSNMDCKLQDLIPHTKFNDYDELLTSDADRWFFQIVEPYIDDMEPKCLSCEENFVSPFRLLTHMSLHVSWYRFQCSKCSFLSFNKFDCVCHAVQQHNAVNKLINSTVLPLPRWKMMQISHPFTPIDQIEPAIQSVKVVNLDDGGVEADNIREMPHLERAVVESQNKCQEPPKTPEMSNQENEPRPTDTLNNSTGSIKEISGEETGTESSDKDTSGETSSPEKDGKYSSSSLASNRPVRNRVKSIKTVQNDFIYDMTQVMKMNEGGSKNKARKHSSNK